jgi:hypothetical protein
MNAVTPIPALMTRAHTGKFGSMILTKFPPPTIAAAMKKKPATINTT